MNYLNKQLWDYAESAGLLPKLDVQERGDDQNGPVFAYQHAAQNILLPPGVDTKTRDEVIRAVPKRDEWRCHMKSSQALTQSVFANLIVGGNLRVLNDLTTDQGKPAFGIDLGDAEACLEYKVKCLGEKRSPSYIDVFISGAHRIAVECKFTESEFKECTRPQAGKCNGNYARQQGRKTRCYLTGEGILYWKYVPKLFRWSNEHDHSPCPLKFPYQIARNLLAAYVAEYGKVDTGFSHALIIYDKRNRAFTGNRKGCRQFNAARDALKDRSLLRSCSWQSVTELLAKNASTKWLAAQLQNKYAFLDK